MKLYILYSKNVKNEEANIPRIKQGRKRNISYKQIIMEFENIKENILKACREKEQNIYKENRIRLIQTLEERHRKEEDNEVIFPGC